MSRNPFAFTRSPSQLRKYYQCPRAWFLNYAPGQRWRSNEKGAALIQGSAYHRVMQLLATQRDVRPIDPLEYFWWLWEGVNAKLEKDDKITYGERDSWAQRRALGGKFWGLHAEVLLDLLALRDIPDEHLPRLGPGLPLHLVEYDIRYNQGWPERCIVDYAGPLWIVDGADGPEALPFNPGELAGRKPRLVRALLDYKTVKYRKNDTAAELDAQLMSQQLGLASIGATVDVVGLLDFVVQDRRPHLQFLLRPPYDAHELGLLISDARYADAEIMSGHFPMVGRFTGQCEQWGGCEYKPLCFRSQKHRMTTLTQEPHPDDEADPGITLEDFD